jgi:hypothetical protein
VSVTDRTLVGLRDADDTHCSGDLGKNAEDIRVAPIVTATCRKPGHSLGYSLDKQRLLLAHGVQISVPAWTQTIFVQVTLQIKDKSIYTYEFNLKVRLLSQDTWTHN